MGDEVVVITGCSTGIGRATARAFLSDGWTVYATARNRGDVADLGELGCHTAALDITDSSQVAAVTDRILTEQGYVSCLVNNAGYGQIGALEDVPTEELQNQFDVNVFGAHRMIRAVLPSMRDRQRGTIINVTSIGGVVSFMGLGPYCGSKFALEAMSDALRAEVTNHGIDVVVVEPGAIETAFLDRAEMQMNEGTDRSGGYGWLYSAYRGGVFIEGENPLAHSPELIGRRIVEAATETNPATRYAVGRFSTLAAVVSRLPDTWRDRLYHAFGRLCRLGDR